MLGISFMAVAGDPHGATFEGYKGLLGLISDLAAAQIDKCFGFDTAVEESQRALLAAKVEAASALKGIGVVKLMGRQSGFIAMQASMASGAQAFVQPVVSGRCPWRLVFLL